MKIIFFVICLFVELGFSQQNISITEETVIIPCKNPQLAILRARNDSCSNNNLTTCLNGDEWKEYRRLQDECEKSQSVIMQKAAAQQELSGNSYSGVFNQLGNWHIFWGVIGCASSACGFFSIAHNKGNSWLYVLDIGGLCLFIWEINIGKNLKNYATH
jgi:hypothetical protein